MKDTSKEIGIELKREKDADIQLLRWLNDEVAIFKNLKLVLTGSYAVEALTGVHMYHDDIDINVLSSGMKLAYQQIQATMQQVEGLSVYKQTSDRLEYDLLPGQSRVRPKKLEIQFIPQDTASVIPIVHKPLLDSEGNVYLFNVKSLAYVIASWAIRISGAVENPKRAIREKDLQQFQLLLSSKYETADILKAIELHPQIKKGLSAKKILEKAITETSL